MLWARLRNRGLKGLKVRRQHPIGSLVLDFYCPDYRLAIEVDGGIHLEPEVRLRDRTRDEVLSDLGIRTLRVLVEDVEARMEFVLLTIQQATESRDALVPPLHGNGEGAGG